MVAVICRSCGLTKPCPCDDRDEAWKLAAHLSAVELEKRFPNNSSSAFHFKRKLPCCAKSSGTGNDSLPSK